MTTKNIAGYTQMGSGTEKVIVLHGWWSDYTAFEAMFPYLDKDHFTYVFMDHRGYGTSREIPGDHSIAEIAGDALALADHLGWRRFHVAGHSMGGMAVQKIIQLARDRIQSAVAITPVPACGSPLEGDGRVLFHGAAGNDDNRRQILKYLTSDRLSESWYDQIIRRSRETTDATAFHDYMRAWTETDFSRDIQGADTPILIVVGEYDQAITADAMSQTLLEWFPNATFDIIENAGHFPMVETPARLATLMEDYMMKHADL